MNDKHDPQELARLLQVLLARQAMRAYVQLMERLGVSVAGHRWMV